MPRERLRVLYVMHTAAPDGSSASLQHLIAHLPGDDVEPYVVSPNGPVADALRRAVHLNERGMLHAAVIAHRMGARVVMHARSGRPGGRTPRGALESRPRRSSSVVEQGTHKSLLRCAVLR